MAISDPQALMECTIEDLMAKIRALAPTRQHKLSKDMVDGSRVLAKPAAVRVITHLETSPAQDPRERALFAVAVQRPAISTQNRGRDMPQQLPASTPEQTRVRGNFGDIPGGFYATPSATGNNDLDFWKVTEGKKPGIRFVKRVLGGGTAMFPQLVPLAGRERQVAALNAILDYGIEESTALYAEKEQRCMDCGRQLTDEVSRKYGKGPVCRANNG